MNDSRDHARTAHLVGVPATDRPSPSAEGRLAPALLLAHALECGLVPPGPVIVCGPSGAAQTAAACGLTPHARVAPPLGEPSLARPALRRVLPGADRLVCWSDECAPLARRMATEVRLISTRPGRCRLGPRHFAGVTVLTETDARLWRLRGGDPRVESGWIDSVRSVAHPPAARRLREETGIGEGLLLIGALSDQPAATDARGLAFLLSVLRTTGYPVCGVAPSVSHNTHAARRHIRGLVEGYPLLVTDRPIVELLHEIDAVTMPEADRSGAGRILEAAALSRGCRVIRLSHRGKAGLKSTPGAVAPILETLDAILAERRNASPPDTKHEPRPEHAHG